MLKAKEAFLKLFVKTQWKFQSESRDFFSLNLSNKGDIQVYQHF